ncbi:alginate lyase family protein [Undibacterium sp.]|jgi:hypothetical protein|uniref:alginate lyase family protein n=1 Tax=Undibacterium sp. TaxID=1914977 RepID=UPI002D142B95|nr:alginate lyase family protein [Undibacterium sp.]HTD04010.1 alginate lyase family protein [Undibacterium sp.]
MRASFALIISGLILAQQVQAAPWCSVDAAPDKFIKSLRDDADKRAADHPRAVSRLHTEGTLPHQGIWDQSIEAKKDLPLMRELALVWRSKHDKSALERLTPLLDAWAGVYQPSYNPIDETDFDALIDAYAIAQADLPAATRDKVAALLHGFGAGYIDQMQRTVKPGKSSWINNWQSHRIKLATLAAVALGDARLFDAARTQFRRQLNQNLRPNGVSIDFEERDALHYTVYDLEPLVRAAMAARTRGEDWLNLPADNGATLAAGLNWLLPYALGEKTHEEYVHTTVKFDLQRRDAGVPGFTGQWEPRSSGQLYWLASTLDARYLPVAQGLINEAPWIGACWQRP